MKSLIKPLAVWATAGVIAVAIASIPTCSQAAEPLVAQWNVANDDCRGGNVEAQIAKDCKRRDGLTRALLRAGYIQGNHEEWYTVQQFNFISFQVTMIGEQLPDAIATNAIETLVPNLYTTLRTRLSDAEIVGLWTATRDRLRTTTPTGCVIMRALAAQIVRYHSQDNDVRFNLN